MNLITWGQGKLVGCSALPELSVISKGESLETGVISFFLGFPLEVTQCRASMLILKYISTTAHVELLS